jgi:hypothetical protein
VIAPIRPPSLPALPPNAGGAARRAGVVHAIEPPLPASPGGRPFTGSGFSGSGYAGAAFFNDRETRRADPAAAAASYRLQDAADAPVCTSLSV